MLTTGESAEEHLASVDGRIDFSIPIFVGVDEHFRRLRDDDAVIEHGDAEGGSKSGFLHKDGGLVGAAGSVGVFEDDDAVPLGAATAFAPVVDALGDEETALRVKVDVGRIGEHR